MGISSSLSHGLRQGLREEHKLRECALSKMLHLISANQNVVLVEMGERPPGVRFMRATKKQLLLADSACADCTPGNSGLLGEIRK
jgi:hypothetical protein